MTSTFAPPSHPPPLIQVELPRIDSFGAASLQHNGWATVDLDEPAKDPLAAAFEAIFEASKAFFDLPLETKQTYAHPSKGSEEGWSRVPGEKELLTLRCEETTPPALLEPARVCWQLCGELLSEMLGGLAESLNLPHEALTVYSEPCTKFGPDRVATILRLFRYEGTDEPRIVSERAYIHLVSRSC